MRARIVLLARCLAFACGVATGGATSEEEGLALYLPFEEGSGDTAYDRSGRNNHGMIHGSATWVDRGVVGKALKFDGESFIRLADGDVFGIDDEMTLSFWARNDDQPWSRWAYVFCICDPSGYGHRQAYVRWGYNSVYLQVLRCNQEGQKREPHYFRVGESESSGGSLSYEGWWRR